MSKKKSATKPQPEAKYPQPRDAVQERLVEQRIAIVTALAQRVLEGAV